MARWSLRNQEKIAKAFGEKQLVRMTISLNRHFKQSAEIQSTLIPGDKYETIVIDDTGHTSNLIAFYIIRKTFDVYNLAFKEFIG